MSSKGSVLAPAEEDGSSSLPSTESEPLLGPALTSDALPYTAFSLHYRWYLTILLGYLCLASSLTANIYFPLVSLLATEYNVSIQDINLTITLYIVMQGISPSIFSPLSDTLGRRPVYLISFGLYVAASIGLALNKHNYVALLVGRAIQSAGGSATLSLAYAVVADCTTHAERGKFLAPMMTATNIGPSIGPIIGGGVILATGDPSWAFWALFIFGASALILVVLSMRETNRSVVGNGAVKAKGVWQAWIDILPWCGNSQNEQSDAESLGQQPLTTNVNTGKTGKGEVTFFNPFVSLQLVFMKETFTILYTAASPYGAWYTITASIPLIYKNIYGFNDLAVGCCYLAGGGGILIGGLIAGRLLDWNYRRTARESGFSVDRTRATDITHFPIEQARSRGSYIMLVLSVAGFVGYGWALQRRAHPAVPLVLQFFLGTLCTILHQIYSALLVDVFTERPGTAGAANNICRCALAAALVTILQPVVDAIGRGWFFTLIGLWHFVGSMIAVYMLRRWVPRWRAQRGVF